MFIGWLLIVPTTAEHTELRCDAAGSLDPAWGLTKQHKLFNLFFVWLPKLAVVVLLFLTGVSFICLSKDDTELIIDTLAVRTSAPAPPLPILPPARTSPPHTNPSHVMCGSSSTSIPIRVSGALQLGVRLQSYLLRRRA